MITRVESSRANIGSKADSERPFRGWRQFNGHRVLLEAEHGLEAVHLIITRNETGKLFLVLRGAHSVSRWKWRLHCVRRDELPTKAGA